MYINPAVVGMFIARIMALFAAGGALWKLADRLGSMKTDIMAEIGGVKTNVAVVVERLDGHIKSCGPQKSQV